VRGVAEGLVVVNDKGQVLLMNDTAEKMLGVEKEKKIGKKITDDIPDELLISLAKDQGQESEEKVVEFVSKNDNVKKVLRSSSAVIQNEEGQTIGMLNILTDVTKQRELDEMKKNFVANVTHELRTPIVAMQKATAILTSSSAGSLNETQANFMNIVSRNLSQLSRLVEDLLDVAKIDSGKMKLKLQPCRLDKVLNDTCDMLDTWAKSKNLEIIRHLDKNFPEILMDADKITQVMNNLISNAIKFTPQGGKITVSMTWDQDPNFAKVSVADTGVGISKEDLPKLFRRFEQFGDQQGIVGIGLGLSISKEIVERHGGRIWAESAEKQGSTFSFTLSLKPRVGSDSRA
jgi:PAS domain S-box-containing protein